MMPREALAFLRGKRLRPGFSYKDVWREEHAAAFTVAKAMQLDVLADLHAAVNTAMEKGQTFDSFRKSVEPTLREKGWWGKKQTLDPLTGEEATAQLGSARRLKTIYNVNMRQAFLRGQYERIMGNPLMPYMMYRLGNSREHRPEHMAWEGIILPKDDPWWDSHYPMNDWGCNCYVKGVTEGQRRRYIEEGIPTPKRLDGTGGGTIPAQTAAPPDNPRPYFNERKGTLEWVPQGVHPAFNWHQGKAGPGRRPGRKARGIGEAPGDGPSGESRRRRARPACRRPPAWRSAEAGRGGNQRPS